MKNEEVIKSGKLNEIIYVEKLRTNNTLRIQQDFEFCPTLAEQHTAHLSDLNYLIKTYKPDELAAYIAAKNSHKQEILGHDFSQEPSFQDAKNRVYNLKKSFENLDPEIRDQFKNHVEFLKFIDNPANAEKMLKLGLMTKKEIADNTTNVTTTTQEAAEQPVSPSDLPPVKSPKKS